MKDMGIKPRLVFLSLMLLFAVFPGHTSSYAQDSGREYFSQSGHWVSGDFLTTYRSNPEPEMIYGYPITEAFQNPTTGRIVQYFQKAYFELHTENPVELRVFRTLLGEYLYEPGQSIPTPANSPGCRVIPATKRPVCYAFLSFFDENGGITQFGYPISGIEIRNARIVQYFQRAVFEWHPERPSGQRVILGDLGWQYFWSRKEDPLRLRPPDDRPPGSIIQTLLNLKVRAFSSRAVIPPGEFQTLFVIVQDQNLLPIEDATVYFTVRYPSGREANFFIPELTDQNGITRMSFRVDEKAIGLTEIVVTVTYDKFKEQTVTSFRLWW